MSDAYGTMVVCGDYEGDIDGVISALNSLPLNTSAVKFEGYGNDIQLGERVVEYPTAFPKRDSDAESYSLEQLSNLISPLLTKGTIELVAVGAEKLHYVYYERLIIRSDGSAERHMHQSDAESRSLWNYEGSESYDPRAKKRSRAKKRRRS